MFESSSSLGHGIVVSHNEKFLTINAFLYKYVRELFPGVTTIDHALCESVFVEF